MQRLVLFGIALFLLILLVWMVYISRKTSPISEVQREIERLKQLGEPTTFADLLPPVPPNQDGTPFYRLAIAQLEKAKKQIPSPVWDSVYEFISRKPSKPFNLADVQKTLQAAQPALRTLRKALNYPHMRLTDWSVENPMSVIFPHLSKFREFARLLVAEGKWRKQKGDIDGAIESHITALKLVRRMDDEPLLLTFLVQGAIFFIAFQGLQQVLEDSDASPQMYRALMAELRAWEIDHALVRTMQAERVFIIASCDWMRRKASVREVHDSLNESPDINLAIWLGSKNLLVAKNELKILKLYEAFIKVACKGLPYDWKVIQQIEDRWNQEIGRPVAIILGTVNLFWDANQIARFVVPSYPQAFQEAASFHALQRILQVAMALRLYRREKGRYPETLQELVPKYLPTLPIDPFDGKPLRYKRLQRGFKVWSVGFNMKDEGGFEVRPGAVVWQKGDIVWKAVE